MGPSPPVGALMKSHADGGTSQDTENEATNVSGMAIMSTHPRDFEHVLTLSKSLPSKVNGRVKIVPCFGIHPWFLHEVSEDTSQWIKELEDRLQTNPNAMVGEIGLDGFHFDPETEELTSSMERQVEAFRLQMELAARLARPVSIHTVQCFGPLFDAIHQIKKDAKQNNIQQALPPKMYFHAFGGKAATIDQLLAMCGKQPGQVYFGFAPIINFRSPKTADVVRRCGIERLVLETDHEDAACVPDSIEQCIQFLATTLDLNEREVIERTTANSYDLYGLN